MLDVQLGDRVVIVESYRNDSHGEVVKVGRVWIEVQPDGFGPGHTRRFRLDDQTDGSQIGVPARFYTLTQHAEWQRQGEASRFLSEQGIRVDYGSAWRGREVELADLLRTAEEEK